MPNTRYRLSERMARFKKRKRSGFPVVVSEGDSWFSYELFPNIIDLLDDEEIFAHLRLEMSGDTVENMLGSQSVIDGLRDVAGDEEALFVLFSGGGNDMQNNAEHLFRDEAEPEDCLVPEVAQDLFERLLAAYDDLVRTVGPTAPVVSHGYDFFLPSDEAVRIFGIETPIGPWFQPWMEKAGILDPAKQQGVAKELVERFNEKLEALQAKYADDFVYVDLRGTLDPEEWENEIHPTRAGFRKIADAFISVVHADVRELLLRRA